MIKARLFTKPANTPATVPVALVPNCAATRYKRFTLDGSGPAGLALPPETWDGIARSFDAGPAKRVNLDQLDAAEVAQWHTGQTLLLSGKVLTGRDAVHKRLADLLKTGQPLPVSLKNRVIYYVGPVAAVAGEAVGPAGPTTATRMDKFVDVLLAQTGLLAMIGKAERGSAAITSIKKHGAAYLMAVGGAAYLLSRAITQSQVLAFEDLGMEAIHEFELKDFPVTVAVDATGKSIHEHIRLLAA